MMSAGIPSPLHPYWGPASSNVDWCEQNYQYSSYFAELWNTLSNIPMIVLGVFGIISSLRLRIGYRFPLGYFTLAVVGVGSWMFHMTLLYKYQLMDELPMILGSLVYLYILLDLEDNTQSFTNELKQRYNWLLAFGLFVYGVITFFVMAFYVSSPLPMNISYGILVAFLIIRSFFLWFTSKEPEIRKWFVVSCGNYLFGFFLWLIEKNFCHQFAFAQYLHVCWHVLAGYGTYVYIMWASYIQAKLLHLNPKIQYMYGVPYVDVRRGWY